MPRWLLPWLFPVGLVVAVVAVAISPIVAVVLAVVGGLVGVPLVYRAYQANRPGRTGDGRDHDRRADPPNNRSLLR
jgi:hypothetical protein